MYKLVDPCFRNDKPCFGSNNGSLRFKVYANQHILNFAQLFGVDDKHGVRPFLYDKHVKVVGLPNGK